MLAAMSTPEVGSDDMRTAVVTLLARAESLNQGARSVHPMVAYGVPPPGSRTEVRGLARSAPYRARPGRQSCSTARRSTKPPRSPPAAASPNTSQQHSTEGPCFPPTGPFVASSGRREQLVSHTKYPLYWLPCSRLRPSPRPQRCRQRTPSRSRAGSGRPCSGWPGCCANRTTAGTRPPSSPHWRSSTVKVRSRSARSPRRSRCRRPTITKVVDTLERHGFVERIRDEHDRRVWRVKVTTRGKRQLERSRTRRTEWLATQLRGVTDAERARIMAALDVLEQFTAVPPREAP